MTVVNQVTPGQLSDVEERIRRGRVGSLLSISDPEKIEHYQTNRVTKDGQRIVVSMGVSALRSESGQIVGSETRPFVDADEAVNAAVAEGGQGVRGALT